MEVLRVFNNNVVLARDAERGDVILTGRGLGFQTKPRAQVDQAKVVRVFLPEDGRNADNFGALVAAIPRSTSPRQIKHCKWQDDTPHL